MAILKKMLGLPEDDIDDIENQEDVVLDTRTQKESKTQVKKENQKEKRKKTRNNSDNINISAFSKMEFVIMNKDSNVIELGEKLMYGIPLVLNYSKCDVKFANRSLQFLSGVIFALDGEIEKLTDKIYMFIGLEEYQEKEIKKFIKDYKED